MYVCLCNGITEDDVERTISAGASCVEDLSRDLGVATGCGCCREHAESLLQKSQTHAGGMRSQQADAATINAYAV